MPSYRLTPEPTVARGPIIAGDPAQRRLDRILLGHSAEAGPLREFWLDISGEQVFAAFGKRGTGKSYTLGVLIEGLAAGQGESKIANLQTPRGGIVFDIMDIYWASTIPLTGDGAPEVRKQYEVMRKRGFTGQRISIDVWLPAGFENSEIDPPGIQGLRISPADLSLDDWAALFEVDIYNEPRGMLIADAVQHVGSVGYQRQDGTFVPACRTFGFTELLACLQDNADLQTNYQSATIRAIRQRLVTFASLALFQGVGTTLSEVIRPYRTSVLMLARVPDALKKVIVSVMLRGIIRNRRDVSLATKRIDLDPSLAAAEKRRLEEFVQHGLPRTWVFMDEAHVLAGTSEGSVATDAIVKYAKEGRNYGLSLAVATQQPSALDTRLVSQVETLVSHQLTSPADASLAARSMRSPAPTTIQIDGEQADVEGLLRRLGQGEAIFSCGNAPLLARSCVIAVRPRVTAHGGYEA
jgi:hypothetical protein